MRKTFYHVTTKDFEPNRNYTPGGRVSKEFCTGALQSCMLDLAGGWSGEFPKKEDDKAAALCNN
jgi:hypothetical protein